MFILSVFFFCNFQTKTNGTRRLFIYSFLQWDSILSILTPRFSILSLFKNQWLKQLILPSCNVSNIMTPLVGNQLQCPPLATNSNNQSMTYSSENYLSTPNFGDNHLQWLAPTSIFDNQLQRSPSDTTYATIFVYHSND